MTLHHGKYLICDVCEKEEAFYFIASPNGDELWDACSLCAEKYIKEG